MFRISFRCQRPCDAKCRRMHRVVLSIARKYIVRVVMEPRLHPAARYVCYALRSARAKGMLWERFRERPEGALSKLRLLYIIVGVRYKPELFVERVPYPQTRLLSRKMPPLRIRRRVPATCCETRDGFFFRSRREKVINPAGASVFYFDGKWALFVA